MNRLLSKRTLYSMSGLVICLAIIYFIAYSTLIQPLQAELTSTNKSVALFEAQVDKLGSQPSSKEERDQKSVTEMIPSSEQPDEVLISIEKFASSAGIAVNSIKSGDLSTNLPEGIKGNSYTLEGTTTNLENANTFLTSLKKGNRLFLIDKLTVNKTANEVSFTVTFTGFHTAY